MELLEYQTKVLQLSPGERGKAHLVKEVLELQQAALDIATYHSKVFNLEQYDPHDLSSALQRVLGTLAVISAAHSVSLADIADEDLVYRGGVIR